MPLASISQIFEWLLLRIPSWQWLTNLYFQTIVVVLVFALLAWLILLLFSKVLDRFAAKTATDIDDLIFERTRNPLLYLSFVGGIKLAALHLGLTGTWNNIIDTAMAFVFLFILSRVLDVIIEIWGKVLSKRTSTNLDDVLLPLFHRLSKVVFVIIAILWALDVWGIDITPYLAGVGISGIVLGLALQDSLKNVLGGVSLIIDGTYKVKDKIKLESGEVGEVIDIGLRSTKIRTYDNELLTIPNGYLANSRIQNYTKPNAKMRVGVDFGVSYGSDVAKVRSVVVTTVSAIPGILESESPQVHFLSMGDFSLNFKAYFWVPSWKDAYVKKIEAVEKIYLALQENQINIPFPTHEIHLKQLDFGSAATVASTASHQKPPRKKRSS